MYKRQGCCDVPLHLRLYSATRQQAERLLKRAKLKNTPKREYPLILRRDTIKVVFRNTALTNYWFKFPVFGVRGGIWLPIVPHCPIHPDYEVRETKLIRKKRGWFLHITVRKEVELKDTYSSILAVDLGQKHLAVSVILHEKGKGGEKTMEIRRPRFYGGVRRIRRHYNWLRRRLGKKKLVRVIKRLGEVEKRKVNDVLHKISRMIVNTAKKNDAIIVLGKLKGIRKRVNKKRKGKVGKRIVNTMPYYKLTQYILYKAHWEGIRVVIVPEYWTSQTCHRCGARGKRPYRSTFICTKCGLEYHADLNGAITIGKLSVGYSLADGGALLLTLSVTPRDGMPSLSCLVCNRNEMRHGRKWRISRLQSRRVSI